MASTGLRGSREPRGPSAHRIWETRIWRPSTYSDTLRVTCIDRSVAVIPYKIAVKRRCLTQAFVVKNSSRKLHFSSDRSSNRVSENTTETKLRIKETQLNRANKLHVQLAERARKQLAIAQAHNFSYLKRIENLCTKTRAFQRSEFDLL